MKRRDFMTNMALTGAGLALTPHLKAAVSSGISPNEKIQVALIGARNMGGKTHLPSLIGSPECQLVGICDVDQNVVKAAMKQAERRYARGKDKESFQGVKGYTDFREVIQNPEIDAVLIATPDHWHCPIAKAAILAGKDVYVEKPLSLYIEEGRELSDLAKEKGAIVQVGSQQRSGSRFFLAEAIAKSGALGKIQHAEVAIRTRPGENKPWQPQPVPAGLDYDMWVGPVQWFDYHEDRHHYNWRFVPAITSGEIGNWGAHFIDSAQQCLGTDFTGPTRVKGTGERHEPGAMHTTFFNIDVDFQYANGVTMKFKTGGNEVTIVGDKGRLKVSRDAISTDPKDLLRAVPSSEIEKYRKTKGSHIDNWLHCVRNRNTEDLHAPVEIGHRSVSMCHLANIAIELGRPLQWDPEKEIFLHDGHANAFLNRPVRKEWKM